MPDSTGDNAESLHRILQLIFISSLLLLLLHFFYSYYDLARDNQLTGEFTDTLIDSLGHGTVFGSTLGARSLAFLLLAISLLGAKGKKDPAYTPAAGIRKVAIGLALYFGSAVIRYFPFPIGHLLILDLPGTATGYLMILHGGNYLSRIVWQQSPKDIFNRLHETFPQEERLLVNEYSVNLPAHYQYRNETRSSWINLVNPFRGTLILGLPGSGKTRYIIQRIIRQQISKGYAMLLYDFKYDDLSRIAYNCFLQHKAVYPGDPAFYNIQFDDLSRSNRCNPLAPETMNDIMDAAESARTCLLGMNMDWVAKQGDFFVESPINFMTALIWFLRRYEDGRYCTLPHVIELAQVNYKTLFTILRAEPEIEALVNSFVNALLHGTMEQLDGQVASATISLARLSSPGLYYVLTGNDLTLDLNDPEHPKILTIGNTPQKAATYAPVLSLYINSINRLANRKGMIPFAEVLDEFSTVLVQSIDKTIATGRSNRIAVTLAVQDASQLRLAYGKEFADVVLHTCGNIISGQNIGDTAKWLSERFGKSMQDRESLAFSSADATVTLSRQLEPYVPVSRISSLSAGEFVGMVADDPDQAIELKAFCCRVEAEREGKSDEKELPVVRQVTPEMVMANFKLVKADVARMVREELERIETTPELRHLVIG
jgi:hypothetical protein